MRITRLICMLLCVVSVSLQSQSLKFYTVDRELSSSLIHNNYQDRLGNIWIATEDGLNRYDGAKFSVYKNSRKDKFSINSNSVHCLCEDKKGNLFVGTSKGIQIFDHATDKFISVPFIGVNNELQEPSVRKIGLISDGSVLIATYGFEGMYRLKQIGNNRYEARYIKELKLIEKSIGDFYEDHQKFLWISMENGGLLKTKNNKIIKKYFAGSTETTLHSVTSICEDNKKELYVGTSGRGVFVYNSKKDSFEPIECSNPNLPVITMYPYNEDNIYIGTDGYGLKILDIHNKKIKEGNIKVPAIYLDNSKAHTIIKDHAGNLWIGFFQKGLMMIPNSTNKFNYIGSQSNDLNLIGANSVSSVFNDKIGKLWVGTDYDGLYIISQHKIVKHILSFDTNNHMPSTVVSTFKDSNNDYWVGTSMNGIIKIKPSNYSFQSITEQRKDGNKLIQKVNSFIQDNEGRLWIGSSGGGLYLLNLNDCKPYNVNIGKGGNNRLVNKWINVLFLSNDGKLYIGNCNGMECLNISTMRYEPISSIRNRFPHIVVSSIYEDKENNMWVGTSTGLIKLNKKREVVEYYSTENGLSNDIINRIEADDKDNLWISTNYGLNKFDTKTNKFLNFYSNNGLQGNEFNKNASTKDERGNIYFGGINGINYFNPQDITASKQNVEVFISDFYLQNTAVRKGMKSGSYDIIDKAINDADEVNLSYNDNSFSIEFSNLEFNNNEHICYQYSINGENWISLQNGVNIVSFSNLAAGKYDLRYRAKNYDNYSQIKSITIIVHPAWYASIPAKIIYILLIALIIYFVIHQIRRHYRVKQEIMEHIHATEINETKLQFFINISHEIRTPMSLIIGPLQKLICTDPDESRQKSYKLIYNNSRRILQLINQLMDLRKIDKGQMPMHFAKTELIGFTQDIYNFFEYQADSKNITFNFTHKDEEMEGWIDPNNFDKVIINLLSNAFKYTPANGLIELSVERISRENGDDEIQIIVSDNGESIKKEEMERIFERFYQVSNSSNSSKVGTGIGLHLTRLLVELHHGTINVENNDDGGCRFIVEIPYGNKHLSPEEIAEEEEKEELEDMNKESRLNVDMQAEETIEKETNKSKTRYRVLIVEDDDEIRSYISNEFSTSYHIMESCNGKEALSVILSKKPDLVISDVMMPEMDGVTLCKKIKLNVNVNYIPVILLTAKCREEDNIEGLNAGADAYITKPFNIEILRNTVDNLLRNREVLRNCFTGSQEQEERQTKFELKSTDNKLLDRIMNVINSNISNPELSVDMIASEVGISRVHLHRKLKELTNQTTRDLIRNTRLKQAVILLESKQYNVSEAAMMTGFNNITIFSRAFKELYGKSPTNYLNGNKGTGNDESASDIE